jgi:hypothetical protein
MCRHSAAFRLLSISRKQSAKNCASADKLGDDAGDGFGLLFPTASKPACDRWAYR